MVNYKKAFFILLIIFVVIIILDVLTFVSALLIPNPSSPEEVCYALSWDWNDYVECIKNIT